MGVHASKGSRFSKTEAQWATLNRNLPLFSAKLSSRYGKQG